MKYWKKSLAIIMAVAMILSVAHAFSVTADAASDDDAQMNRTMPTLPTAEDVPNMLASVDFTSSNGVFTYNNSSLTASTLDLTVEAEGVNTLTVEEARTLKKEYSIVFRAKLNPYSTRANQPIMYLAGTSTGGFSTQSDRVLMGMPGTSNLYYQVYKDGASVATLAGATTKFGNLRTAMNDKNWHTIAIVQSTTGLTYYVDGIAYPVTTSGAAVVINEDVGGLFTDTTEAKFDAAIGRYGNNSADKNWKTQGNFDFWQLYDGALTVDQIRTLSAADIVSTLASDVKTYTDVGSLLVAVPDTTSGTSMQGMTATENYIYVAKQKSNNTASVGQYNMTTGEYKTMEYYTSTDATTAAVLNNVKHCNDMTTHTYDGQTYLITANAYNPNDTSYPSPCLTSFLLDEENGKMYFTGYYNLTRIHPQSGATLYLNASSLRWFGEDDTHDYYLIKSANEFYWCKIEKGNLGKGDATVNVKNAEAESIPTYHLFTIDNRNAVFAKANGETYTIDNLELWTNQGCGYSPTENAIYVPLWNGTGTNNKENVILVFDMGDRLKLENLQEENVFPVLFPSKRNFHIQGSSATLEFESCVIMDQGTDELTLYYNTNGTTTGTTLTEGIWYVPFTRNNAELESIADENSIVYTVEYNYGVEGVERENWLQNNKNHLDTMLASTIHVVGNTTNLRVNKFYRQEGYAFLGYNLYRQSDGKWQYADDNWYTEAEAPAGTEKKMLQSAAAVDNLTTVNGDLITAYAQWDVPQLEITVNNVGAAASGAVLTAPANGWVAGTNTFTVSCEKACVVVVSNDGGATYTRLTATTAGNGYSFTVENMTADTIVAVCVLGDANGDGNITNADITKLRAAFAGKETLDSLQQLAVDTNGSGDITNADITKLRAVFAGKTTLGW